MAMRTRHQASRPSFSPPLSARRILSGLGRVLIGFGVLVLLFVAYLLWGTGIVEASHQHALRDQFEHELAGTKTHVPSSSTPTSSPPSSSLPSSCTSSSSTSSSTATSTPSSAGSRKSSSTATTLGTSGVKSSAPGAVPAEGQPVGILQIPRIGLNTIVVQGTSTGDLYLGPGHYPGTPLPGQAGNSAIAGHRTTYGAPFYGLNELQTGDPVFVTTTQGRFCYQVTRQLVVKPSDVTVVAQTSTPELTLTTCNPRFSATSRLVVQASLVTPPAPSPRHLSLSGTGRSSTSPSGLAGEQGSWVGALIWGAACAVLGIAVWALSRRLRRPWVTYALGAVPLLVLLFVFFQHLAPLLPASF